MDDLISREKILKELQKTKAVADDLQFGNTIMSVYAEWLREGLRDTVKNAPAIDAEKVIRCANCVYRHMSSGLCYKWDLQFGVIVPDYGYCFYGERRTNGAT